MGVHVASHTALDLRELAFPLLGFLPSRDRHAAPRSLLPFPNSHSYLFLQDITRCESLSQQQQPTTQRRAAVGRGTDLANHLLRSVQDLAREQKRSCAILFVDLTKAFDLVIREIVFDWLGFQDLPQDQRLARGVKLLRMVWALLSASQAPGQRN